MYTIFLRQKVNSKKNLFAVFILISCFSFGQNNETKLKEIETLYDQSYKSYTEAKNEESLVFAEKAKKIALEIGDSKSIARTYNQIARAYTNLGKNKEALVYIDKAMAEKFSKTDPLFHAKLIVLKANNHTMLGLYEISTKEYFEALDLLKNETKPAALREKVIIYALISYDFYNKGDYQSALKYENLKVKILNSFPEEEIVSQLSTMYDTKGSIFLVTKKFDSAYHYLNKGYELKKKYNDPVLYQQYIALGDYYNDTEDYKKALEFYLKGVENFESLQIEDTTFTGIYKNIADVYAKMGNKEKENFYLNKHADINHKELNKTKKDANEAIKMIVNEKDEKLNAFQSKSFLTIGSIVLGVAALIFGLFVWYRKTSKKTDEIISETRELLTEKEELLQEATGENQELKLKVNESFEEVIQLAKDNSVEFFTRFKEVYPEIISKLLEIDPKLRVSELTLCAYLFLGFRTKDIAQYTFKSVNTIRNRKHNLKNKLNIPADENMELWFKNLSN